MKKKLKFAALVIVLFSLGMSCTQKHSMDYEAEPLPMNGIRSQSEAIELTYDFWDKAYGRSAYTKAMNLSRPEVKSVATCSTIATKNSGEDSHSGVYVINFEDNNGFSVVNINTDGTSVFALSEQGNIDAALLDSVLNRSHSDKIQSVYKTHNDTNFVYEFLAESILNDKHKGIESVSTKAADLFDHHDPMIKTKWGQAYPFNQKMPKVAELSGDRYRGRAMVGCAVIAAAQLMKYNNHPAAYKLIGNDYAWSDFDNVAIYQNLNKYRHEFFDNQATSNEKYLVGKLAKGLSSLASKFKATYDRTGTNVWINDVVIVLANLDSYYKNARMTNLRLYFSDLIDMLDDEKPVLVKGEYYNNENHETYKHAWLSDGYLKMRENIDGEIVTSICLHFNWGWMGDYDGYYSLNSFLSEDRIDIDLEVDIDDPWSMVDNTDNYNSNMKFIKY